MFDIWAYFDQWTRLCGRRAYYVALLVSVCGVSAAWAVSSANQTSPLGINLQAVTNSSVEQPFLDIFKTNAGWTPQTRSGQATGEEKYLDLDANGWVRSLRAGRTPNPQRFTQASTFLFHHLPDTPNGPYPAGQYIVSYVGEGTLVYGGDAAKDDKLSRVGRDVINVAAPTSEGGILITLTSTDPRHLGNYIRDIRLVRAEQEGALAAGNIFSPRFLGLLQNFRVLRFMDWFSTNNSRLSSWSNRPLTTGATWASSAGVPYEVALKLVNAVSADPWLNIPLMADDDYISQLAMLVHAQLGRSQRVYVELSNEVWNDGFSQWSYANSKGSAMWPGAGRHADYANNWYGMRTAQSCDIWKAAWGSDASRVICVMAAQAANPRVATEALNCKLWSGSPCAAHGIGAVAIAPYFADHVPSAWTSQPDGGLNSLFASFSSQNDPSIPMGGWLGQAASWVAAYSAIAEKYKLPLIAYEGGQSLVSYPQGVNADGSGSALTRLYAAANRDARMKAAYRSYLQVWKATGGQLFVHFNDIFPPGQYGEWGALESFMQATAPLSNAPPKWQALQNFISANPCWWPGC
jgi:hypothetical protein